MTTFGLVCHAFCCSSFHLQFLIDSLFPRSSGELVFSHGSVFVSCLKHVNIFFRCPTPSNSKQNFTETRCSFISAIGKESINRSETLLSRNKPRDSTNTTENSSGLSNDGGCGGHFIQTRMSLSYTDRFRFHLDAFYYI